MTQYAVDPQHGSDPQQRAQTPKGEDLPAVAVMPNLRVPGLARSVSPIPSARNARSREDGAGAALTEQERERLKELTRMPDFGAVFLDNPKEINGGWACVHGGKPFYFSKREDLPSNIIWVTTLDWAAQSSVRNIHNLRRNDFLRTPLARIAADMGVRSDGHNGRHAAQLMSGVVQRTCSLTAQAYGFEQPDEKFKHDTLADAVRAHHVPLQPARAHVHPALMSAYQVNSQPSWVADFDDTRVVVTLRKNRLHYFTGLMDRALPDDSWNESYRSKSLNTAKGVLDKLLDEDKPCLVEAMVELRGSNMELATLAAYGSPTGPRQVLRKWISQPELRWLVKVANVQIQSAMICEKSRRLPAHLEVPQLLRQDPLFALSTSAGLVVESHYQALSTMPFDTRQRRKYTNSVVVWLRAYDRAEMFAAACEALRNDFIPLIYGNGSMTLRVKKSRLPELVGFASDHGFANPSMYPILVEHGLIDDGSMAHG